MYDEIDMCQRSINQSVQTHLDAVVHGALIRGSNDIKSGIDSALTTGKYKRKKLKDQAVLEQTSLMNQPENCCC